MHNSSIINIALVLSFLLASAAGSSQAAYGPAPQDGAQRNGDLIRTLYEGDPAAHLAPFEPGNPAEPNLSSNAPDQNPPAWSRLAFESFRYDNWDIYLVNPDGSGEQRLTAEGAFDGEPALNWGAQQVAFSSDRSGNDEIYTIHTDGSNLSQLTNDPEADTLPVWSPDGTWIAFQSKRTGDGDVYKMHPDGTELTQLTNLAGFDGQPSWSPDGNQIVFVSKRSGAYELWAMQADGSNSRQLTHTAMALYPAWSPSGEWIAFTNDAEQDGWLEIYRIRPDGSGLEAVLDVYGNSDAWGPAWSPDGKWMSFSLTSWIEYQGEWYWTESYVRLIELSTSNVQYLSNDNRVWKTSWASTDNQPPGPCTVQLPAFQRQSAFLVKVSASDAGPAGIDSYDLQARQSSGSWEDISSKSPGPSLFYPGRRDGLVDLRCRARDLAGNEAGWAGAPIASTTVDGLPPQSQTIPAQRTTQDASVVVRWQAEDAVSDIESFNVYTRAGEQGDWTLWQEDTQNTSAVFDGAPDTTYTFRTQAVDQAGHAEAWQPIPQAAVSFYSTLISGTLSDMRGYSPPAFDVSSDPNAMHVQTDETGRFQLYLAQGMTHTLQAQAAGYGTLPATRIDTRADAAIELTLPPDPDLLVNGGFEAGGLQGWAAGGSGAQVVTGTYHSGGYSLQIEHSIPTATQLTQALDIPAGMNQPTLSFYYNLPSGLITGTFSVEIEGADSYTALSASAATSGWVHAWSDMSQFTGQSISLTLKMDGGAGKAWVDELALGPWETPSIQAVSPQEWPASQHPTLTISGTNFIATPAVYLNDILLSPVAWESPSRITAALPQTMAEGSYDLKVVNPEGPAVTLPRAVTVKMAHIYLPAAYLENSGAGYPIAAPHLAADWPMLGYDPGHSGYNRADTGGSRYALEWSAALPFSGGSPLEQVAVADGVLVASSDSTFSNSAVVALAAESGAELWRYAFMDKFSLNPPAIGYGMVYFQEGNSYDDSYLFCVDLYTGERNWQSPFSAQWEEYLAPTIADGGVYVNAGAYGGLAAYNVGDGRELWFAGQSQFDRWTPAYADETIYSWVEGYFAAFDALSGELEWQINLGGSWPGYEVNTAAVIVDNTALVVSSENLYAIDLVKKNVRWSAPGNFADSVPAAADGTVYALKEGQMEARRLNDGALLWSFAGDGALAHAPLIAGQYVYVASPEHTFVLHRGTHALEWDAEHGGWLSLANGFLYIAQADKTIYAYRAQEP